MLLGRGPRYTICITGPNGIRKYFYNVEIDGRHDPQMAAKVRAIWAQEDGYHE